MQTPLIEKNLSSLEPGIRYQRMETRTRNAMNVIGRKTKKEMLARVSVTIFNERKRNMGNG